MNYPAASYGVSPLHPQLEIEQAQLLRMELRILLFLSLLPDIVANDFFIAIAAHRVDIVPVRPELAAPQHLFDLGCAAEDFSGRQTFDNADHLGRTVGWHRLNEKMNMGFVRANLEELDWIAFGDFETYVFQHLLYLRIKHGSTVFRRTDVMI